MADVNFSLISFVLIFYISDILQFIIVIKLSKQEHPLKDNNFNSEETWTRTVHCLQL